MSEVLQFPGKVRPHAQGTRMERSQADRIRALIESLKKMKPIPGTKTKNPLIRARDELVELAGRWPTADKYETAERLDIVFTLASAVASIELVIEEAKRPAG
jgi:hypothetical protein